MKKLEKIVKNLLRPFITIWTRPVIDGYYGGIWKYRDHLKKHQTKLGMVLYNHYLTEYGAWVGIEAEIAGEPRCPHGCFGLFISKAATIGKNCVIFQHVTIGSVTTAGSKHIGAPTIGDNVYIGAGAKIIGNIHVGDGVRIGANCVVVNDVPANSIVYMSGSTIIQKEEKMDNTFSIECLTEKEKGI